MQRMVVLLNFIMAGILIWSITAKFWVVTVIMLVAFAAEIVHAFGGTSLFKKRPAAVRTPSTQQSRTQPVGPVRYHVKDNPSSETDESYGITDDEMKTKLKSCKAMVRGVPGYGLGASGFEQKRIDDGQKGERSLAKALIHYGLMDDPNIHVWFSVRNPGDESGKTDIDCIIAKGDTMWLLDAKHYMPEREGAWLDAPYNVGSIDHTWYLPTSESPLTDPATANSSSHLKKLYDASSNMDWARDKVREKLAGLVKTDAVVLLTRTSKGVHGTLDATVWPGNIPACNVDNWILNVLIPSMSKADAREPRVFAIHFIDGLVKR